jgi:hypothetical protein
MKIMTSWTLKRKMNQGRQALLGIKVKQNLNFLFSTTYLNLGVRSGSASASKWTVGS